MTTEYAYFALEADVHKAIEEKTINVDLVKDVMLPGREDLLRLVLKHCPRHVLRQVDRIDLQQMSQDAKHAWYRKINM